MNKGHDRTKPASIVVSHLVWTGYLLAALALPALLFWSLLAPNPWTWIVPQRATILIDDQAYRLNGKQWRVALENSLNALTGQEQAVLAELDTEIDNTLNLMFKLPRSQVSEAADWYYSGLGQVARHWAGLRGMGNGDGYESLADNLGSRLFPEEEWSGLKNSMLNALLSKGADAGRHSLDHMNIILHKELAAYRIDGDPSGADFHLSSDWTADSGLVEIALGDTLPAHTGVAVSASALSTLAARRGVQVAASRAAGRGMTLKGMAACAHAGPLASLCSIGIFTGTFVVTELAILHLDESRNRDDFEAALHADLDRIEQQFRITIKDELIGGLQARFNAERGLLDEHLSPVSRMFPD